MSTTYRDWVAAGKPCLRQSCGHRHGDHIPSEAMECSECDCLGFVGFAHPDDSAVWSSLTAPIIVKYVTNLLTARTAMRPPVVTSDEDLISDLVNEPTVNNLYSDHYPNYHQTPEIPHDGYLADFPMRNKGFIRD